MRNNFALFYSCSTTCAKSFSVAYHNCSAWRLSVLQRGVFSSPSVRSPYWSFSAASSSPSVRNPYWSFSAASSSPSVRSPYWSFSAASILVLQSGVFASPLRGVHSSSSVRVFAGPSVRSLCWSFSAESLLVLQRGVFAGPSARSLCWSISAASMLVLQRVGSHKSLCLSALQSHP